MESHNTGIAEDTKVVDLSADTDVVDLSNDTEVVEDPSVADVSTKIPRQVTVPTRRRVAHPIATDEDIFPKPVQLTPPRPKVKRAKRAKKVRKLGVLSRGQTTIDKFLLSKPKGVKAPKPKVVHSKYTTGFKPPRMTGAFDKYSTVSKASSSATRHPPKRQRTDRDDSDELSVKRKKTNK